VGEQVRVKVVDVDVSRRRISLSTRRVDEESEVLPEPEVEAEPSVEAEVAPEPSADTREALADAEARGDESTPEAFEAALEPEPIAPEESAMHPVPEAETPEAVETPPEEEGEISLESIVEELKRREGRN